MWYEDLHQREGVWFAMVDAFYGREGCNIELDECGLGEIEMVQIEDYCEFEQRNFTRYEPEWRALNKAARKALEQHIECWYGVAADCAAEARSERIACGGV